MTVAGVSGPAGSPSRRLKVGVLVDLAFAPEAGGHVKFWQRLAEAAVERPEQLDLTVHFSAAEARTVALAPTVRYVLLPPVLSTARLVRGMPDDTDLAPWHPSLARRLAAYHVVHTTDAFFCYARTAALVSRRRGTPLVSSIHTNTPEYARMTMDRLLERWLGAGVARRAARDWLDVPGLVYRLFERRLATHLAEAGPAGDDIPRRRAIALRRGLDRDRFHPRRRDRAWLEHRFALPPFRLVLLYAGKLAAGKNVRLLVPILRRLGAAGLPAHLLCAGQGEERAALETALGPALTCAGTLDQAELARVYASADLFVFPSEIDEFGNAPLEALASGLPALVARGSGIADRMADCPGLRVLPGDDPAPWVAAIRRLAATPGRRVAMGRAARAYVEARVPGWREILDEDLLPVWRAAAGERGSVSPAGASRPVAGAR